jgi:hypothetical protein
MKERSQLGDQGVDVTILKWFHKETVWWRGLNSLGSGQGRGSDSCADNDELLGYVKGGSSDKMRDY